MDITNVFKASVKSVRTRNRAYGIQDEKQLKDRTILSSHKSKSMFTQTAKDIVSNITRLKELMETHKKANVRPVHLSLESSELEDNEREQIDANIQLLMQKCAKILGAFREECRNRLLQQDTSIQQREHQEAVYQLINSYLRNVCQSYSKQQAVKIKRAVDMDQMFKLSMNKKRLSTNVTDSQTVTSSVVTPTENDDLNSDYPESPFDDDENLTTADIQTFEEENERIFNELSTLLDDVHRIEGQVVEISKLQDIFTSKILEQERDLDRVADVVVGATENIKDGNEEIRQTIKTKASFRVWVLFFIITMAFSLLFLDWYNV